MEYLPTSKSKWRTVRVEGARAAAMREEGMLGFDIMEDVKVVKKNRKGKNVALSTSPRAKKREAAEDKAEDDVPVKKKRKKKRKPKKKGGKKEDADDNRKKDEEEEEVEVQSKEEEEEDDDWSELSSRMSAWSHLFVPAPVLRALDELGFRTPTPIQSAVLPAAVKGRADVLGAAETGSGKTLAFGIPLLAGILADREREQDAPESDLEEEVDVEEEASSEEEEDMEDEGLEGPGCVRVVNDVQFDFSGDDEEFFAPPVEVVKEFEAAAATASRKGVHEKLRALVLTPTRELAVQVKNHLEAAAKHTGVKVACVVGGLSAEKQNRLLKRRPEVVVATPGRLWDLIREGNEHLASAADVGYLVIDEADRMVEKGHFEELHQMLEMLNADEAKRAARQNMVFSATLSLVHEAPKHKATKKKGKKGAAAKRQLTPEEKLAEVTELVGMKADRRKVVDLTRGGADSKASGGVTAGTLTESKIHCDTTEKDFYLYYFTQAHPGRTLVFCNSIDCVRRLVNLFAFLKVGPLGLHAQMRQKQRLKNLDRFAADPDGLLVATDVAARGLDIKDVQHVVHYQVPRTSESYVHRSGRTARASKEGLSVMLIDASENHLYKKMCRTLNKDEDLPLFPVDRSTLQAVRVRVQLAREIDKLRLDLRKEEVSKSWWKRAAEEADLAVSDSEDDEDEVAAASKAASTKGRTAAAKEAELAALLSRPLSSSAGHFSGKYPTKTGRLELPGEGRKLRRAVEALDEENKKTAAVLKGKKRKKGGGGINNRRKKQKSKQA